MPSPAARRRRNLGVGASRILLEGACRLLTHRGLAVDLIVSGQSRHFPRDRRVAPDGTVIVHAHKRGLLARHLVVPVVELRGVSDPGKAQVAEQFANLNLLNVVASEKIHFAETRAEDGPTPAMQLMARLREAGRPSRFAQALLEFHHHPNVQADERTSGMALRRTLLEEEFAEWIEAMEQEDDAAIARESADMLYVIFGTTLARGIDLDAAFEEVHRACMDKAQAGVRRDDGKIVKPPGFVAPDMTRALRGSRS